MTGRDPEGLPENAGTAGAAAGLLEGLVRDWVTNGSILLSLIVLGAGIATGEMPWQVVGPIVGAVGAIVGFVTIAKKWPIGRTWGTVLAVIVVDVVLLVVMFG